MTAPEQHGPEPLHAQIRKTQETGEPVKTVLKTAAQVIARVTDGIYSEPASAFRELISNAYDADATRVVIQTDRPRFSRITIADDGHGMSARAVAHLVEHIGGSAKRTPAGAELGVTRDGDAHLSPDGRRLIGKIGIGLFSVSQLTSSFQIITKVKDEPWRTVATVALRQFAEPSGAAPPEEELEAGLVSIWQEPAADVDTHGTTIVLNGLKPAARGVLRSSQTWLRVSRGIDAKPPRYHVGAVRPDRDHEFDEGPAGQESLPWTKADSPKRAFERLVEAVTTPDATTARTPKLAEMLDYYLQMVWRLSLSAPLPYVGEHPFDSVLEDVAVYALDGPAPDRVRKLDENGGSVSEQLGWPSGVGVPKGFSVLVDDLELLRPVRFRGLPVTSNVVKSPQMFVGHLWDEFPRMDPARSGGPLEFYAYLMWVPKIVPNESVGSLVRIHGASGTGFDETFFRYQVAETTRLRQITCEIFVVEGLEASLNIDREKYNFAHNHVNRLTGWLHTALSRSIGTQKSLARDLLRVNRSMASDVQLERLESLVDELWQEALGSDADSPVPPVRWTSGGAVWGPSGDADAIVLSRSAVLGAARGRGAAAVTAEGQVAAIAQMLSAFELLDHLDADDVELLMRYVARVVKLDY
jgi:hypothetical protein